MDVSSWLQDLPDHSDLDSTGDSVGEPAELSLSEWNISRF